MELLKINKSDIKRLVLHGGRKRQTAQEVLDSLKLKPDYIINAMMYDTATGITSADTIIEKDFINGGNYTPKGIAFNNANDLYECESNIAHNIGFKYFMGGSPNLLWNGEVNIDRYNVYNQQKFSTWAVNYGTAKRIAFGFNDSEIVFYFPSKNTTIKKVAEYMKSIGCKAAINLDGGGSTKVCKVEDGKLVNLNTPTENRPNSTWILVYLTDEAKKELNPSTTDTKQKEEKEVKYKVMLDPGHGGKDPGAVGNVLKLHESEIALNISMKTKAHLERCGIDVLMTRTADVYSTLSTRTELGNKSKVDRYVSIHCNSASNLEASGVETWCYNKSGNAYKMSTAIQKHVIELTGEKDRGVKLNTGFVVLRDTYMSSCIVECGFISHKETEASYTNDEVLDKYALGIAMGICEHLGVTWVDEPKVESKPTVEETPKYDMNDWRVVAMKNVCDKYALDMDVWYAKKDQQMTVGEFFGIMNKITANL